MRPPAGWWTAVSDLFTGVPIDQADATPAPTEEDFGGRLATQLRRRPGRLISACLATVLGPAVVAQASYSGIQPLPDPRPADERAGDAVPVPIPGDHATWLQAAGRAAATCPGLPSTVLVAIGHVESSLGLRPETSSAGAVGPMQFLPATWAAYAADGDGDGLTDVMNVLDAVHGAARLLCANGGADPDRLPSALWNYNHSDEYVRQILAVARFMPAPAHS